MDPWIAFLLGIYVGIVALGIGIYLKEMNED